jgi:hypothetical protein
MNNATHPQFETMLKWYLAGDAAACAEWVLRYHKETGRKLTQQQCLDYVNYLFNDMEIKIVDHAREQKMDPRGFIKQLQTDLDISTPAEFNVVEEEGEKTNDNI